MRLLLASKSPRRVELLAAAGFVFDTVEVDVDERPQPGEGAEEYVRRLAVAKVRAAGCREPGTAVLGADTIVVVDGDLLGKPATAGEAAAMLRRLSGRSHDVLTGLAVGLDGRLLTEVARTEVRFLPLSEAEVNWYLASGESFGRAGAYAIQGRAARFVDTIAGSYSNVVGLPVAVVYRLCRELGGLSM